MSTDSNISLEEAISQTRQALANLRESVVAAIMRRNRLQDDVSKLEKSIADLQQKASVAETLRSSNLAADIKTEIEKRNAELQNIREVLTRSEAEAESLKMRRPEEEQRLSAILADLQTRAAQGIPWSMNASSDEIPNESSWDKAQRKIEALKQEASARVETNTGAAVNSPVLSADQTAELMLSELENKLGVTRQNTEGDVAVVESKLAIEPSFSQTSEPVEPEAFSHVPSAELEQPAAEEAVSEPPPDLSRSLELGQIASPSHATSAELEQPEAEEAVSEQTPDFSRTLELGQFASPSPLQSSELEQPAAEEAVSEQSHVPGVTPEPRSQELEIIRAEASSLTVQNVPPIPSTWSYSPQPLGSEVSEKEQILEGNDFNPFQFSPLTIVSEEKHDEIVNAQDSEITEPPDLHDLDDAAASGQTIDIHSEDVLPNLIEDVLEATESDFSDSTVIEMPPLTAERTVYSHEGIEKEEMQESEIIQPAPAVHIQPEPSSERVRVAGVGTGGIFRGAHLPCYPDIPHAQLVALCDPDPEALKLAYSRYQGVVEDRILKAKDRKDQETADRLARDLETIQFCADISEVIDVVKPDLVDICTQPFLHTPLSIQALEAGINVMCEKPVSRSWLETDKLLAAVKRTGKLYQHNENWLYEPDYYTARKLITSGAIGEPILMFLATAHGGPEGNGKFWNPDFGGGGALLDNGIHAIGASWFLSGLERTPTLVKAAEPFGMSIRMPHRIIDGRYQKVTVDDDAHILIRFEDEASGAWSTAHVEGSWSHRDSPDTAIIGTTGRIHFASEDGRRYVVVTDSYGEMRRIDSSGPASSFYGEIQNMVECVRFGATPISDAKFGADCSAIVGSSYLSQKRGKRAVLVEEFRQFARDLASRYPNDPQGANDALINSLLSAVRTS